MTPDRGRHPAGGWPEDVDAVLARLDQLCWAYAHVPAERLHRATSAGVHHVASMLGARPAPQRRLELLTALGWLRLLGGCLENDLGRTADAERSRLAALRLGREAGDSEIIGWSWELAAWFALTQGRYAEVVACAEAGLRVSSAHGVGVQLHAQAAKAHARMGDVQRMRTALSSGRSLLDRLTPDPERAGHHFVIDPDKWGFYEMDAFRIVGLDDDAAARAHEVIRAGTAPDGVETAPMRVAEARLTLAIAAARSGALDEAVSVAGQALCGERRSLPSLLMVADELRVTLERRYPLEPLTASFVGQMMDLTSLVPRAD